MAARINRAIVGVPATPGQDDGLGQLVMLPVAAAAQVGRLGGYAAKPACWEALAKSYMPNTYPAELQDPISPFTAELFRSGNAFEEKIGQLIGDLADPSTVALIEEIRAADGNRTPEGKQAKEAATLAAIADPAIKVIFNARIGSHFEHLLCALRSEKSRDLDPDRISEPDILVKDLTASGRVVLYPIDVKDHSVTHGESKMRPWIVSRLSDLGQVGTDVECADTEELEGNVHLGDFMQLAHYWRHLQNVGFAPEDATPRGAIIGREEFAVWANLDTRMFMDEDPDTGRQRKTAALEIYDRRFAYAQQVIANAKARDINPDIPAIVAPEFKAACHECVFRTVCEEELVNYPDGGHITLLPGITTGMKSSAPAHYAAGVYSIGQLARLDVPTAAAIEAAKAAEVDFAPDASTCPETAKYVGGNVRGLVAAIQQARVYRAGKVYRAPGVAFVNLPRAVIEIDFDLENSAGPVKEANVVSGRNSGGPLVYMFGARATGRRKRSDGSLRERVEMHTFADYTDTDAGERRVFVKTWEYFQYMIAKAKHGRFSIRFYHYTGHERVTMRRLAEKHAGHKGVPTTEQVEEFFASNLVVDMYEILSKQLIWPTRSHSIKHLAKHARHSWRGDNAGGDQSIVWYRNSVVGETPKVRRENRAILTEYNEDDVIAQRHLRDWLSALGAARTPGDKIPGVETLRKPLPPRRRPA